MTMAEHKLSLWKNIPGRREAIQAGQYRPQTYSLCLLFSLNRATGPGYPLCICQGWGNYSERLAVPLLVLVYVMFGNQKERKDKGWYQAEWDVMRNGSFLW